MTTRRDVIIGIAGVAAAAAVPVEAVASATDCFCGSIAWVWFNGIQWARINDLVWDGHRMYQVVGVASDTGRVAAMPCSVGDLEARKEYRVHCPHLPETV